VSDEKRVKYGLRWPATTDDLSIELYLIKKGGRSGAYPKALPVLDHFMNARRLLWPSRYRHRWTDLLYKEFLRNDITILMGSASCQKTSHAAEFALINYWSSPENTLVILSTITVDKLQTGIFGEVKMLFEKARERKPWLSGNLLEGKNAISTDTVDDGGIRDMRKGIIGRPCYSGSKWVGLGTLAGTKQENIIFIADELQFMAPTFIASWPNLFSNGKVKIIGSGNPKHDPDDQLGIAAEPKEGWASIGVPDATEVWSTRFLNGRCVNLIGTDSPNFDVPADQPEPFPKLIGRKFVDRIEHDWGKDSPEYYSQVKGVMRIELAQSRVITRQLCREHLAQASAQWKDTVRTKIIGLDPTYGGQDRCIAYPGEFGEGADGKIILKLLPYQECKINLSKPLKPEDQIAQWLHKLCIELSIPEENVFYDATGKGTIGYAFAREFGVKSPVAVDSGGMPTHRPVREGLMVEDGPDGQKRPKTCREHYSKFVTEMWFSVRYCIEANQLRELSDDTMMEGCARVYYMVAGNKIEVEPKTDEKRKEDLKRRLGKSPDLFDALAIMVEGARQRGFVIASLGPATDVEEDDSWQSKEAREYEKAIAENLLDHTV